MWFLWKRQRRGKTYPRRRTNPKLEHKISERLSNNDTEEKEGEEKGGQKRRRQFPN